VSMSSVLQVSDGAIAGRDASLLVAESRRHDGKP
jgi:hypothetical protein